MEPPVCDRLRVEVARQRVGPEHARIRDGGPTGRVEPIRHRVPCLRHGAVRQQVDDRDGRLVDVSVGRADLGIELQQTWVWRDVQGLVGIPPVLSRQLRVHLEGEHEVRERRGRQGERPLPASAGRGGSLEQDLAEGLVRLDIERFVVAPVEGPLTVGVRRSDVPGRVDRLDRVERARHGVAWELEAHRDDPLVRAKGRHREGDAVASDLGDVAGPIANLGVGPSLAQRPGPADHRGAQIQLAAAVGRVPRFPGLAIQRHADGSDARSVVIGARGQEDLPRVGARGPRVDGVVDERGRRRVEEDVVAAGGGPGAVEAVLDRHGLGAVIGVPARRGVVQ